MFTVYTLYTQYTNTRRYIIIIGAYSLLYVCDGENDICLRSFFFLLWFLTFKRLNVSVYLYILMGGGGTYIHLQGTLAPNIISCVYLKIKRKKYATAFSARYKTLSEIVSHGDLGIYNIIYYVYASVCVQNCELIKSALFTRLNWNPCALNHIPEYIVHVLRSSRVLVYISLCSTVQFVIYHLGRAG